MPISINTNTMASSAALHLQRNSSQFEKSLNRLSSGSKLYNSSDDPGGLAVSMKLSAAINRQAADSVEEPTNLFVSGDKNFQLSIFKLPDAGQFTVSYVDRSGGSNSNCDRVLQFSGCQWAGGSLVATDDAQQQNC